MSKSKKRPAKRMRSLVRVMLCAVKRNLAFVDAYLDNGLVLEDKRDVRNLDAIRKLHEQQNESTGTRGPRRRRSTRTTNAQC